MCANFRFRLWLWLERGIEREMGSFEVTCVAISCVVISRLVISCVAINLLDG